MWLFVKSTPIRSKASSLRGLRDSGNMQSSFPQTWACTGRQKHTHIHTHQRKQAYVFLNLIRGNVKTTPVIPRQQQRLRPWMKEMGAQYFTRTSSQHGLTDACTHRRDMIGWFRYFLCLILGNDLWFLRQEEWYRIWMRDTRGNNIYLDFITSTRTLAHKYAWRFNLNQTLTSPHPRLRYPSPLLSFTPHAIQ